MSDFISGARTIQDNQNDHILNLDNKIKFLHTKKHGVALLKKIGLSGGKAVKGHKFEWNETALAVRRETVTLATTGATSLTVGKAKSYAIDELLRIEDEVVRVTAIVDATTLTIVRAQAGTTAATHTSKELVRMGTAREENSTANEGVTDTADRLYNYVQTFDREVELSNHERAQATTEGNPFTGQLKRRMIEVMQQLAAAVFYGVRYEDTSGKRYFMGGLKQYLSTNVYDASAASVTFAIVDARIKAIVDAGGMPNLMVMGTKQAQALADLDTSAVRIGKGERTSGGQRVTSYQSQLLETDIPILVDMTVADDEIWILDTEEIELRPMAAPGHGFSLVDATANGQDGKKTRILGHYTMKVGLEAAHALIYNLA